MIKSGRKGEGREEVPVVPTMVGNFFFCSLLFKIGMMSLENKLLSFPLFKASRP